MFDPAGIYLTGLPVPDKQPAIIDTPNFTVQGIALHKAIATSKGH